MVRHTKKAKRILFIDCQILQTAAYDRGMGKYTTSLVKEVARQNAVSGDYHEIKLIFNKSLEVKTRIETILRLLDVPSLSYDILPLPSEIDKGNLNEKEHAARLELDKYFARFNDSEITYLMTAPFFVGFPSVFPSSSAIKKVAIVYDITPQKIWHLQKIFPDNLYFNYYHTFIEADLLLTISAAVRDELVDIVGVPADKIQHIDGGPMAIAEPARTSTIFTASYVLMVSAPIVHKNNERAVRAFHEFNQAQGGKYKLYITSTFGEDTQSLLKKIDANVIFTGNISDAELAYGYKHASIVLFPSLAEGLGMPVLEAALHGAPVACSNIPVLSELGKKAFMFFDPTDINDIARVLGETIAEGSQFDTRAALQDTVEKYTWSRSASRLLHFCADARPQKLSLRSVKLHVPNVGTDTAAAELGNYLYMYLSNVYNDVRLEESAVRGTDEVPAVARYVRPYRQGVDEDTDLVHGYISDRGNFFSRRKRKVTIQVDGQKITIDARRTYHDNALKLVGWQYDMRQIKQYLNEMIGE